MLLIHFNIASCNLPKNLKLPHFTVKIGWYNCHLVQCDAFEYVLRLSLSIGYSTIETKEAARIGYNGFLFPHEYSNI
jgi:hypothetical protein